MGRIKLLKGGMVIVCFILIGAINVNAENTLTKLIYENFDGTFPPAGWTVTQDYDSSPIVWHRSDVEPYWGVGGGLPSPMSGYAAYVESFPGYCGWEYDTSLVSPSFSTEGFSQVELQFDFQFWDFYSSILSVDYRIGGGTWITLESLPDIGGYTAQTRTIDISMLAENPDVQIRFRYYNLTDGCDWWATIDNVAVFGTPIVSSQPIPTMGEWGLMILALFLGGISIRYIRKQSLES